MPRIAFATCLEFPNIAEDDQIVMDELNARGVEVVAVPWNEPGVNWSRFDRVIIRSTWDYHNPENLTSYAGWVESFDGEESRLWNQPATVLKNLNKSYLVDLARRGGAVVPTVYVTPGSTTPLGDLIRSEGWDRVVIKPAVSAGADGLWQSSLDQAGDDQGRFGELTAEHAALVQPYMPEILEGEWAIVFFNGEYSHAVLKIPADSLRVQAAYGGRVEIREPGPELVAQAKEFLALSGETTLYARVDGIVSGGKLVLIELELNEPALFFMNSTEAAQRFANAILHT